MSDPLILYGTQSNGETLPVQVDATGRLVAEGLDGPQGPEGPEGPQGPKGDPGEMDLPPNPQEGQVLGWENGALAWLNQSFFFELDYLLLGGGGQSFTGRDGTYAGGGAGGFISSLFEDTNPNGKPGLGPRLLIPDPIVTVNLSIGGPAESTEFQGPGFDYVALAGGDSGDPDDGNPSTRTKAHGKDGASGGGGQTSVQADGASFQGGASLDGQGNAGSASGITRKEECINSSYGQLCAGMCDTFVAGAGGGAGGPAVGAVGGPALASVITGASALYAAGGSGGSPCSSRKGAPPAGAGSPGSGGGTNHAPQPGRIVLRVPKFMEFTAQSGDLTFTQEELGDYTLATFTAGSGLINIQRKPGVVMTLLFDYLRQLRESGRYANRVWT